MFLPIRLLALVLLSALAIAACQGEANQLSDNSVSVVSSDHDCCTIQHEMGETEICDQPQRIVVQECRMQQAQNLLRSPHMTIAQVAAQVGYRNPEAFSTAFRSKFAISPKAYQLKQRG